MMKQGKPGHIAPRIASALLLVCSLSTIGACVAPVELEPTLDTVQAEVFDRVCSGCHAGPTPAGELDLSSADVSYASLVGQPARNPIAAENGWTLVKEADPDLSFVYRKLDLPGMGEGAPMPPGDEQLGDVYFDLIRRWIEEGAHR